MESDGNFIVQISNLQIIIMVTTVLLMVGLLPAHQRAPRSAAPSAPASRISAHGGAARRQCRPHHLHHLHPRRGAGIAVAGMMFLLYYGVIDFYIGFNLPASKPSPPPCSAASARLPGAMLGGLLIGLIETFWSGLFLGRIQGRGSLLDPRDRADLLAVRPARQA